MAKVLQTGKTPGPMLAAELGALVDVPGFAIDEAGALTLGDDVTPEQEAAILAVIAAHDPTIVPPAPPAPEDAPPPDGTIVAGKPLGRSLFAELRAAGVDLDGLSVDPAGFVFALGADAERIAAIEAVIAAHDPTTPYNARADELRAIDAERDFRLAGGYHDAVTGETFQTGDDRSLMRLIAIGAAAGLAVLGGTPNATGFKVITAGNDTLNLTAAAASALITGRIMAWVLGTGEHARALKDQILAGGHPDTSAGWPS